MPKPEGDAMDHRDLTSERDVELDTVTQAGQEKARELAAKLTAKPEGDTRKAATKANVSAPNRDPRNPYTISNGEDYGHALAVLHKLQGESLSREAALLEASDFRCRKCGATMRVTKDEWPRETPCDHRYWDYGIVIADA